MKLRRHFALGAGVLTLGALLLPATSANAINVSLVTKHWGNEASLDGLFGSINAVLKNQAKTVTYYNGGVSAGEFSADFVPNNQGQPLGYPDPFVTFCIDLTGSLAGSYTYEMKTINPASTGGSPPGWVVPYGGSRVALLYNTWQAAVFALGNIQAAGLQLAIWELLYDTDFNLSATTGSFYVRNDSNVDGLAARAYAQSLINGTAGITGAVTTAGAWFDPLDGQGFSGIVPGNKQGLIGIPAGGGQVDTPEAGEYALLAAGILGLVGDYLRRRQQTSTV